METVGLFTIISILSMIASILAVVALFFLTNNVRLKKELQKTIKEKDEEQITISADKNKEISMLKEALMKKDNEISTLKEALMEKNKE